MPFERCDESITLNGLEAKCDKFKDHGGDHKINELLPTGESIIAYWLRVKPSETANTTSATNKV